jgi:hypothetical protein
MYLVLELRTYLQTVIEKQLFRLKKKYLAKFEKLTLIVELFRVSHRNIWWRRDNNSILFPLNRCLRLC